VIHGFLEHDPDCPILATYINQLIGMEIQEEKTQTNVMKLVGREGERA
jgi:hypothetical protein